MATVTIHYTDGTSAPSFQTHDPKVIARYRRHATTDPKIDRVEVID